MEEREAYAALAERLGYPLTERFERLLRKVADPMEARLALAVPASAEELARTTGISPDAVEAKLSEVSDRGLLIPTRKGYFFSRSMFQFHDAILARRDEFVDRELLDLWQDFAEAEWYPLWASEMADAALPLDRVIPHAAAVEHLPGVQPFENTRAIVDSATRFSVVPCTCRRRARKCDHSLDVCLQLNRSAEYTIARGNGPELTKEQALTIIDRAVAEGLIHQVGNHRGELSIICNCCTDCCLIFRPLLAHRPGDLERGFAKSRFEAVIDEDLCTGCELCVDRCQLGAIALRNESGSKLAKAFVLTEKCWGCGACVTGCPDGAATMRTARPLEYIPAERRGH